ncbi:hypothetical protein FSHL1_008778 [Fusarium sambucinum]
MDLVNANIPTINGEAIDPEVPCRICGVSFNIGRYRTEQEPSGEGLPADPYECPDKGGCYFVKGDLPPNEQIKYSPSEVRESEMIERMLDNDHFEHVAGPTCRQIDGYNGHRISAEEMKGCKTFQCLMYKSQDWQQQSDDQDFEVKGNYFLTGLGDEMNSRNTNWPYVFPARHGTTSLQVEYNDENVINADQYGMPFHPTCLEIFKRASLHRYGVVDMKALTLWWTREHSHSLAYYRFPREQAVKAALKEGWWHHEPGNEYLAANPCFIPGFQSLLQSCQGLNSSGPEVTISTAISTEEMNSNPFSKLSTEILHHVLLYLDFKDLASLRLTSRLFLQVPNFILYHLTVRHTPWIYEAWSSLPLSFWATTTEEELEQEWESTSNFERVSHPAMPVNQLDRVGTNWLYLHAELYRNRDKLRGLRNRRRIWKDCEEILNRVDKLRASGKTEEKRYTE